MSGSCFRVSLVPCGDQQQLSGQPCFPGVRRVLGQHPLGCLDERGPTIPVGVVASLFQCLFQCLSQCFLDGHPSPSPVFFNPLQVFPECLDAVLQLAEPEHQGVVLPVVSLGG